METWSSYNKLPKTTRFNLGTVIIMQKYFRYHTPRSSYEGVLRVKFAVLKREKTCMKPWGSVKNQEYKAEVGTVLLIFTALTPTRAPPIDE